MFIDVLHKEHLLATKLPASYEILYIRYVAETRIAKKGRIIRYSHPIYNSLLVCANFFCHTVAFEF